MRDFSFMLRIALRRIFRSLPQSLATMTALTLGIGIISGALSLASVILFTHLPSQVASRLLLFSMKNSGGHTIGLTYPEFQLLHSRLHSVSCMAAWSDEKVAVALRENVQTVKAEFVTDDLFSCTNTEGQFGAAINTFRDTSNDAIPTLISAHLARMLGFKDGDIVGKTIMLGKIPAVVSGVYPSSFSGFTSGSDTEILLPISKTAALHDKDYLEDPSNFSFMGIGQISAGHTSKDVVLEVRALEPSIRKDADPTGIIMNQFFHDYRIDVSDGSAGYSWSRVRYGQSLRTLLGVTGVFVILCFANIGVVMSARALQREPNHLVQTALGATPFRIAAELCLESVLMVLPSIAGGSLIGLLMSRFLKQAINTLSPLSVNTGLSWSLFWKISLVSIAISLVATLVPLRGVLRRSTHGYIGSGSKGVVRQSKNGSGWILFAQGASSVVLIALSFSVAASLNTILDQRWGLDFRGTVVARVDLGPTGLSDAERSQDEQRLLDAGESAPGALGLGLIDLNPLTGDIPASRFFAVDTDGQVRTESQVTVVHVTPGYFAAIGTPILAGALPNAIHGDQCVISENLQRKIFRKSPNLIPGRIYPSSWGVADGQNLDPSIACQIVGIAQDAYLTRLASSPPHILYYLQSPQTFHPSEFSVITRFANTPTALDGTHNLLSATLPINASIHLSALSWLKNAEMLKDVSLAVTSIAFIVLAIFLVLLGCSALFLYQYSMEKQNLIMRSILGGSYLNLLTVLLKPHLIYLLSGALVGCTTAYALSIYIAGIADIGIRVAFSNCIGAASLILAIVILAAFPSFMRVRRLVRTSTLRVE